MIGFALCLRLSASLKVRLKSLEIILPMIDMGQIFTVSRSSPITTIAIHVDSLGALGVASCAQPARARVAIIMIARVRLTAICENSPVELLVTASKFMRNGSIRNMHNRFYIQGSAGRFCCFGEDNKC